MEKAPEVVALPLKYEVPPTKSCGLVLTVGCVVPMVSLPEVVALPCAVKVPPAEIFPWVNNPVVEEA